MRNVFRAAVDNFEPLAALSRYYGSEPSRVQDGEEVQEVLL